MYKNVYQLSRDQFDELKSAYFWGEDTDNIPKLDRLGLPALFPGDIPDQVVADYYAGIDFVDDDFSSPAGVPWTDSRLHFYVLSHTDGSYSRQWMTEAEARKRRENGWTVALFK